MLRESRNRALKWCHEQGISSAVNHMPRPILLWVFCGCVVAGCNAGTASPTLTAQPSPTGGAKAEPSASGSTVSDGTLSLEVVTYDTGSRTATLDAAAGLAAGVTYIATMEGGTIAIHDPSGNPLAVDTTWSFTTAEGTPSAVRIMPLGDSITHGWFEPDSGVQGGYRINLYSHLTDAGYAFDFVGSQVNGPQPDKNHEGWGGYKISELHFGKVAGEGVKAWLTANPADTVLLVIGTNDVMADDNLAAAPNRLSALIDAIRTERPSATVYVGSIPPLANTTDHAQVRTYNDGVRSMVATKASSQVRFVDMYSALTTADLVDGIHPDRTGYDKMAAVWSDALVPVAPGVSSRSPAQNATGVSTTTIVTATFSEAIDPATVSGTTVTLSSSAGAVSAAVTYDGATRTATLDPIGSLAAAVTYTATVKGGIKDLAGNALAADSTWTFTTAMAPAPPPPHPFSDIIGHPFQTDILWLSQEGITAGCAPMLYCPDAPVTREQMASFLVRALGLLPTANDFFTDDEASIHEADINRVAQAGIAMGCGGGRYCPQQVVTREQMASFLVRGYGYTASSGDFFTDDELSIHEADINKLATSGVTAGCGGTYYCPTGAVTRGQMAAFLHRAET